MREIKFKKLIEYADEFNEKMIRDYMERYKKDEDFFEGLGRIATSMNRKRVLEFLVFVFKKENQESLYNITRNIDIDDVIGWLEENKEIE